jgi:hypothetical protein
MEPQWYLLLVTYIFRSSPFLIPQLARGFRNFANKIFANMTFANTPPGISPIGESPLYFRQHTLWTFANTTPGISPIGESTVDFSQGGNIILRTLKYKSIMFPP